MDDQVALRVFLSGREVACPGCGYCLRDCAGRSCPECGMALEIVLRDPGTSRLVWRVAAVCAAALAIGEGLMGIVGVYTALHWYSPAVSLEARIHWGVAVGRVLVALGAGVGLVLLLRRPGKAGAGTLRWMLAFGLIYGIPWVLLSAYWFARWWDS